MDWKIDQRERYENSARILTQIYDNHEKSQNLLYCIFYYIWENWDFKIKINDNINNKI